MSSADMEENLKANLLYYLESHNSLQAYDEHLNLMLSDVEEKISTVEIDPLTK